MKPEGIRQYDQTIIFHLSFDSFHLPLRPLRHPQFLHLAGEWELRIEKWTMKNVK
jgi:hypothetical protein